MEQKHDFQRPEFNQALAEWKKLLQEKSHPADCQWVFHENLCFESSAGQPGDLRVNYQTRLTPPPADAEAVGYGYFSDFNVPIVFYRIGTCHGKSVCTLLCDEWFAGKTEKDGFIRRADWGIAFQPGSPGQIEEITDAERYQKRLIKGRPLHDLDFALSLRSVHEILAHGHVLTSYEHYALRFLHAWSRFLGQSK